MNIKAYKDAIAVKCRQCVGPWSGKYNATTAELIDVCDKKTCGLHKFRPRLPKAEVQEMFKDILG